MRRDPRKSVNYMRMNSIIDLVQKHGPLPLDQICKRLKIDKQTFTQARGGLPGRLALEDRGLSMPRPVTSEGYVYKLASTFSTGPMDTDGEPNIQTATSDLLTRVATIYIDVDTLVGLLPGRTRVRRLLQKLQKALETTIISADEAAGEVAAPVSAKAEYVLDLIFPPGSTPLTIVP